MTVMMATCWLVVTHGPARIVENGLERNLAVNVSNFHGIDGFLLSDEYSQTASSS